MTVDTPEYMVYLTELAKLKDMIKDLLFTNQKDMWWKLAFIGKVVNLFMNLPQEQLIMIPIWDFLATQK